MLQSKAQRFDDLVRPHVTPMYRFAYRLLGNQDDAEDLVQDVLGKLYPRTAEIAALRDVRPWLHRVLYNEFIDLTRRRGRRVPLVDGDAQVDLAEDPDADPERLAMSGQTAVRVERALEQLDDDQRALVSLHLMEGHTLEELTTIFDAPLGTLKSRMHRTKARLKTLLQMEPFAPHRRDEDMSAEKSAVAAERAAERKGS